MSSAVNRLKEQQSFLSLIEKKLLLKSNYKQVCLPVTEAVNEHDNSQGINYTM